MGDFLNKLKKSIDKGSAIVSAKSTTMIETNKLKSEMGAVTRVKSEALMTLGRQVYEEGKEGSFSIENVEELITKISEQEVKLVDLQAKITLIQEEEKAKMDELNAEEAVEVVQEEVQETVVDAVESAPVDKPEQ